MLGACNWLARAVTKWTKACDRRLFRSISYIHCTKHWVIRHLVGDAPKDLKLTCYSDASFAGDLQDSKSTTGGLLYLVGPRAFVPLTWICKKQGAASHSSTEAEIIGLNAMIRPEGLPNIHLWTQLLDVLSGTTDRKEKFTAKQGESACDKYQSISLEYVDWVPPSMPPLLKYGRKFVFVQDNDTVIKMVVKGHAPLLKHVSRTHRVDLDWSLSFRQIYSYTLTACRYVNQGQFLC